MQNIVVKYNQCNLDLALMAFGTLKKIFELPHIAVGASITDELIVDNVITVTTTVESEFKNVHSTLNQFHLIPSSKKDESPINPSKKQGIGFWIIGQNFKVS